jgi:hypothetical protein
MSWLTVDWDKDRLLESKSRKLKIVPIFQKAAFAFIESYHRHHKKPVGSVFQIAVGDGIKINGVAIVGRPVARMLDNKFTLEVTRLCTDGTPNACSMLYAACWRIAKEMGYERLITYILNTEPGTSLKASGWTLIGERGGGSWSVPSRPRTDKHPLQKKLLFEKKL